jgi:hypothetical protein
MLTFDLGELSFIIPPALGGQYTIENTAILSITEHYSVYASIHQQIKDLPDGTQVVLKIKKEANLNASSKQSARNVIRPAGNQLRAAKTVKVDSGFPRPTVSLQKPNWNRQNQSILIT